MKKPNPATGPAPTPTSVSTKELVKDKTPYEKNARVTVERLKDLTSADLNDLCDATEEAILQGGGFGWLEPPERWVLENYWNGVVLIPQRFLWVGRLDGVIAGSVQLQRTPKANEAQRYVGTLSTLFIAPWARNYGISHQLIDALEDGAQKLGMRVVDAAVRTTQTAAMALLESLDYQVIGTHPYYAQVNDEWVSGRYFTKAL
ncbi:MAG: GNAT family N-acetyltransferase [Alphaproteobacteria bacterium]